MLYQHGESIIKIAFADDNQLMQDLVPPLIDSFENCKVIIQAFNGRGLLEKLARKPDTSLALIDMKMPEMDGIDTAKKIKMQYPDIRILFFSNYCNELVYKRIISVKANGFVSKDCTTHDLRTAIYSVMRSGYYIHGGFPSILKEGFNGGNHAHRNGYVIKDEEVEFLRLVGTDLTYEAIAGRMKTSLRHVDYIREGLFEKFELHSRVELALLAYNAGINFS